MNAELKQAIDNLGQGFDEFKSENDARLKALEDKGHADPVLTEKVDKLNAQVTEFAQVKERLDEVEIKVSRPGRGPQGPDDQATAEHAQVFDKFFRRGVDDGLRDLEVQARAVTSSDPEGGYLVPEETEGTIDRILGTVSAMRNLATVRKIGAPTYKKLVNIGGAGSGWVGEQDSRPETGTPKLVGLEFTVMELYAEPAASQTMLDDAFMDIGEWLGSEVSIEFAEQEGDAFLNGNGVSKPKGLLAYNTVANASYAWGKIGFIKSGASGAFVAAADGPGDCIIDLIHTLKSGYRQNSQFLMNDLVCAEVRKVKDTDGNYLWRPGLEEGKPDRLLGYPISYDDNMPDLAANSLSIAFGDFKRAYLILDRVGIRVLRDPYLSKPNVLFYTTKRVGGGVQNFEAVKLMKFAA